jgi:TatA/E family protein of Tat protein translocase
MFGLGTKELIIIAIILILLFGTRKIPELAKSVVEAVRHLKGIFRDEGPSNDSGGGSVSGKKR